MNRDSLKKSIDRNISKTSTAILKLVGRKSPEKETREQKIKRLRTEIITIEDKIEMCERKLQRVKKEQNYERNRFNKKRNPTLGDSSVFANRMKILIYEESQLKDSKGNYIALKKRKQKKLDSLNK